MRLEEDTQSHGVDAQKLRQSIRICSTSKVSAVEGGYSLELSIALQSPEIRWYFGWIWRLIFRHGFGMEGKQQASWNTSK
jgi:hypothetical protein